MFQRGDLVLDRDDRGYFDVVYFVIAESGGGYYWVRSFGSLSYGGWNKYTAVLRSFNAHCLTLPLSALSEEKHKIYQEFKMKYLDKDLV